MLISKREFRLSNFPQDTARIIVNNIFWSHNEVSFVGGIDNFIGTYGEVAELVSVCRLNGSHCVA